MPEIVSEELISEVLISEVLGYSITSITREDDELCLKDLAKDLGYINIKKLVNECRKWAWTNGFYYWNENNKLYINKPCDSKVDYEIDIGLFEKSCSFKIDFKACLWILENKINSPVQS